MLNLRFHEREPVTVGPDAPVAEIVYRMDDESVGSVVVVDSKGAPIGIVTDRDLVRRVVAAGRDAEKTCARDVMSADPVVADRREPLPKVLEKARLHSIRRLPLTENGRVVSVASLDDSLFELAIALFGIAETARVELRDAERSARKRRRREARETSLDELRGQLLSLGRDARERLRSELARLISGPSGER
jgi:CBS domain-containing protein